jgi:hypothetical protein
MQQMIPIFTHAKCPVRGTRLLLHFGGLRVRDKTKPKLLKIPLLKQVLSDITGNNNIANH